MKSILLSALAVLLPLSAFAQDAPDPRRRVVLPPRPNAQPPQVARVAPPVLEARRKVPGLSQNVTITLRGALQGLVDVELELTGCGPEFVTDYTSPAAPDSDLPAPIMTIKVVLTETRDGFHAEYSLGARVARVTQVQHGPNTARNIEYRDVLLQGAAHLAPGKPVTVSNVAGKPLVLSVTPAE